MEYEGIKNAVCDAEESDWLDISYSQKYIDAPKPKKSRPKLKLTRAWKIAAVAVLCVAVLAVMLLADGNFRQDVFSAVKSAVASVFPSAEETENKINIPCNLTLQNVQDGVMTFGGGRAAVSLTAGSVAEITEDSVTVNYDDETQVVYGSLTSVMVAVGDKVAECSLLGKYDTEYTVSIMQKGEIVKQVVGSETQLTWNV